MIRTSYFQRLKLSYVYVLLSVSEGNINGNILWRCLRSDHHPSVWNEMKNQTQSRRTFSRRF